MSTLSNPMPAIVRTTVIPAFSLVGVLLIALVFPIGCTTGSSNSSSTNDEPMVDPISAALIPEAPVLSPAEAIADFVVEDGFEVGLVASEPDVIAPVAMTFDGDGAIWVVEMRAYMENTEGSTEDQPIGTIRVLRDLDRDHHYETVTTFLDGLVLPRAIAIAEGGVLIAEPPNLWFVESNDYVAGRKTLVDSTYAVGGNPEHQPNGLIRAIDNWYYSAKADVRYRFRNGEWEKEQTEYRGQWGLSQDDYGRLYYNHNSATLLGDNLTPGVMRYNPNHQTTSKNFGASKASNKVYPIRINPGVNRAYRQATLDDEGKLDNMTAACGPVIFRGDNFPASYYGNAFVMEPAGNLIKRVVLSDNSGITSGAFPYDGREFLASRDERFRPVNSYTGPDGALYVVDMYRGVIQHSTYLTEYLQRQIESRGLAEPLDLGRIYRIKHADTDLTPQPRLRNVSSAVLVNMLRNKNGWWRDMAQQLLVERADNSAARLLRAMIIDAGRPISQLHALWTLEGMGALTVVDLEQAARVSRDPKVRVHILRLAATFADSRDASRALSLIERTAGGDRQIDLQRTLSLHGFREKSDERVLSALTEIAGVRQQSPEFVDAIMGGLSGVETVFMERLSAAGLPPDSRLYSALEQSRYGDQIRPMLAALAPGEEHAAIIGRGREVYNRDCSVCHGNNGRGLTSTAPSLLRSQWVLQDPESLVRIVLDGVTGPIEVDGKQLADGEVLDVMPGFRDSKQLTDADIAALTSFVRNQWTNRAAVVDESLVTAVRDDTRSQAGQPYTSQDLLAVEDSGFVELFGADGQLDAFAKLGGQATYSLTSGVLTGTTVANSPNSFLATRKQYSDFVLEFEVLVDPQINSGVQIRSHSLPDYRDGQVHGYQIEVDPSPRAWSAGIYEEGRRGWLFDLRGNRAAREAFKQNEWNHYRVEARGAHLRTWLNGVLAADLIDDMTAEGFIAFQVHSVGNDDLVGREIKWRNARVLEN